MSASCKYIFSAVKCIVYSLELDLFSYSLDDDLIPFYLDPLIKVCGLKDAVLQAKEKIMSTLNTKVSFLALLFSSWMFKFLLRVSLN